MPEFDTSGVDAAATTALANVRTLTDTPYVATLDADNGPFAVKYTEAFGWGDTFAATTWTGTFDADNGPAAVAYTEAFGWGAIWAGSVFTASFSVDTSGITNAVAVARQAAADIAAVMPHSPAKEGPLKEPITFDYIADNMKATMDRVRAYASGGAGEVSGSFTGRTVRGGRGGAAIYNPTYHIYPETGDGRRQVTNALISDWRA